MRTTTQLYQERVQQGICPRCGNRDGQPEEKQKLCPSCQEKGRQYVAKSRARIGRSDYAPADPAEQRLREIASGLRVQRPDFGTDCERRWRETE